MKHQNSTLLKRLKQYSALAAPMIAVAGLASGQAIYTDVNPDEVLTPTNPFPGDTYPIDLNNDGTTDFTFFYFKGSGYVGLDVVMPYSVTNTNGIMGTVVDLGGGKYFGSASALSFGAPIDAGQNFFSLSQLVSTGGASFFLPGMATYYTSSAATVGFWGGGVTDHYLGLRFSDGTDTFYGWIRCDVANHAESLTVKDYAYNANPNEGLFAGQGDPTAVQPVNANSPFGIFAFEGTASVMVNDGNYDNTLVTVTNMMGQKVIDQPLTDKLTRIDLNQFGKGLYMITIQRGSEQFTKKVSFR